MRELDTREAIRVIKEALEVGIKHITFTGGEPLLRHDIWKLIEEAYDNNIYTSLITNGILMSKKVIDRIVKFEVDCYLSLESASKIEHERIRGKNTWNYVTQAINMLEYEGVEYGIIATISKINLDNVWKIPYLMLDNGWSNVHSISYLPVLPSGRALNKGILPESHEVINVVKKIDETCKETGIPTFIWCMPFAKLYVKYSYVGSCRKANVVDLDPEGNILLCDTLNIKLSNVVKLGFRKALEKAENHPLVKRIEETIRMEPCSKCKLKSFCLGGCYTRSLRLLHDISKPDPLCPIVQGKLEVK